MAVEEDKFVGCDVAEGGSPQYAFRMQSRRALLSELELAAASSAQYRGMASHYER